MDDRGLRWEWPKRVTRSGFVTCKKRKDRHRLLHFSSVPTRFRVPAMYLKLAKWALLANCAECKISNLRALNRHPEFESLPLRQTVWTAENSRLIFPRISRIPPVLAISAQQIGLPRTERSGNPSTWLGFFSESPMISPTLTHSSGEGAAIRNRIAYDGLDFISTKSTTSWGGPRLK